MPFLREAAAAAGGGRLKGLHRGRTDGKHVAIGREPIGLLAARRFVLRGESVVEHLHLDAPRRQLPGLDRLEHLQRRPEKHPRVTAVGEVPPLERHLHVGERLRRADHAYRLARAPHAVGRPRPRLGLAVDGCEVLFAEVPPARGREIEAAEVTDEHVADVHRGAMRLNLDRPPGRQRLALLEVVGQRLASDHHAVVEHHGHAVALHRHPRRVPLADRAVGHHERPLARRLGRIVPEPARALLTAVFEVAFAGRVPDLHLRVAAKVDAAVGTRGRQHPLDEQFEIAVVAVGGEKHSFAVAHDHAVLDLPVSGHVGVPIGLPLGPFLRRSLGLLSRIEMGTTPPACEIAAVEQRREARSRLCPPRR